MANQAMQNAGLENDGTNRRAGKMRGTCEQDGFSPNPVVLPALLFGASFSLLILISLDPCPHYGRGNSMQRYVRTYKQSSTINKQQLKVL